MPRVGTIITSKEKLTTTTTLRPISFLFYTMETVFNMFCMAYHIKGFMSVDMDMLTMDKHIFHYFYLVTFYLFMVATLFQSISICSGHVPTICVEILKSSLASFVFTAISILTMWDAEKDFHLMYKGKEPVEGVYIKDEPVHNFAYFLLFQSLASLACGVLYMLHATILIDVKITENYMASTLGTDAAFVPINIFVLGEYVQSKLEQYDWFHEFCSNDIIGI